MILPRGIIPQGNLACFCLAELFRSVPRPVLKARNIFLGSLARFLNGALQTFDMFLKEYKIKTACNIVGFYFL
ncbi:hypothetical protein Trebr_0029 [Treponema brennaborense DSM 12168]|uniref:Uncharacterized protein n=1 Tax=Treponema brennaborense (strain DSM 12168 / CIP 105900 / DD5/3) TaxID=906968 RepID=F4LK99_TREBD|nr:hypothetical protein Trebr_0029 [Treponema brennaborense DSM 12168]